MIQLKEGFEEFCRQLRLKWHFRNEPTSELSTTPAFNPKSAWKPPNDSPSLEPILSQVEDLFEKIVRRLYVILTFPKRNVNPFAL